ncbi:MAG: FliM/FliN family flagellar motor switch protein [Parvularculaceae bacterium]|nr:FliM/FliN family flagellar motor switch protein [Parvularculaceae bacterium]
MDAVEQIDIELSFVVGAADMPLAAALALGRGAVVALGRDASKPISILANGKKIADGKVRLIGEKIAVVVSESAPAGAGERE